METVNNYGEVVASVPLPDKLTELASKGDVLLEVEKYQRRCKVNFIYENALTPS